MIQLTARIFQDGNLIGYQATDGVQTRNLTKQEAWAYAKQKQIINVVASGTLQNPSLSGTNGFQLKTLPELKEDNISLHIYELNAAYVRNLINGKTGIIDFLNYEKKMTELIKLELNNGVIPGGIENMHQMSKYFTLVNVLDHSELKGGAIIPVITPALEGEELKAFQEKVEIPIIENETIVVYLDYFIEKLNEYKRTRAKLNVPLSDIEDEIAIRTTEALLKNDKSLLTLDINIKNIIVEFHKESGLYEALKNASVVESDDVDIDKIIDKIAEELKKAKSQAIDNLNNLRLLQTVKKYKRDMKPTTSIIGYKLKYTGPQPFEIDRVEVNFNGKNKIMLQTGDTICLSRAETALLLSHPLINGEIANAHLAGAHKENAKKTLYNILDTFYLAITKEFKEAHHGISVHDVGFKVHVESLISQDEFNRYFATDKVVSELKKRGIQVQPKPKQPKSKGTSINIGNVNFNGNVEQVNIGDNNSVNQTVIFDQTITARKQDKGKGLTGLFNMFHNGNK